MILNLGYKVTSNYSDHFKHGFSAIGPTGAEIRSFEGLGKSLFYELSCVLPIDVHFPYFNDTKVEGVTNGANSLLFFDATNVAKDKGHFKTNNDKASYKHSIEWQLKERNQKTKKSDHFLFTFIFQHKLCISTSCRARARPEVGQTPF